jgi:alkylation response protein AidB-like acyl-CoA dehydrogenase
VTALDGAAILAGARALAPEVRASADAIAAQRRLPAELVAKLRGAGVFRMPMPRAWGGPEMTPREQTEVVEILSAADPSVGWCAMIGSDSGFYGAFLDEAVARKLYPDLDAVTAGLLQPGGQARRVDGGYRVSGRWGFGSGCTHADVLIAGCLVFAGGAPLTREQRVALALSRIHAFRVARDVAQAMVDTAGTAAIYASSPLDRLLRDAITMSQHVVAQERMIEMVGGILVGQDAPMPIL